MELKDLYHSAILVFVYIFLLVLMKGTSSENATTYNLISPSRPFPENGTSQYFYFPELEMYFNPGESIYVYPDNGIWVRQKNLPEQYMGIDLETMYFEVVDNLVLGKEALRERKGVSKNDTDLSLLHGD